METRRGRSKPKHNNLTKRGRNIYSVKELLSLVGEEADFIILEGFYSLVKQYEEAFKIVLIRDVEETNFGGDVIATFENINHPEILKLPEQYSQLLNIILATEDNQRL